MRKIELGPTRRSRNIIIKVEPIRHKKDSGRAGRVEGTKELVIDGTPHIVPYRKEGERIEILRVYHSSRLWPQRF